MARVLIVDDSEVFRYKIRMLLEEEGHTIVGEASNGAEGFESYKELRPDVTTMDVTMPIMDGIEALKQIMQFDPSAKVIMVAASAQENKISEAFILGAFDFLPKPFDMERVSEIVARIMSGME